MTQLDRLEALTDRSQRAPGHIEAHDRIDLWVCDGCGFGFDAVHQDATLGGENGIYNCPCCLEAAVWPLLPHLIRVARAAKAVRVDEFMEGKAGVVRGLEELWEALNPLFAEVES